MLLDNKNSSHVSAELKVCNYPLLFRLYFEFKSWLNKINGSALI